MGRVVKTRSFQDRIRAIDSKRQTMDANGYRPVVGRDGLIEMRPKGRRARLMLPLRLLATLLVAVQAFKVFLMLRLGEATYLAHVDTLRQGSGVEVLGAGVMQADPLARLVAGLLAPLVS